MTLPEAIKRPQRRINPYRGLVIDVPTWVDAHEYHRTQQQLHGLLMHSSGIVAGLEVRAAQAEAAGDSIVIHPGVAMDDAGHTIIVNEVLRFPLQTEEEGIVYLTLQYREVPDETVRPPGEDQPRPLYTLEAYRLEERRRLPEEPYVELARIHVSGTGAAIAGPANPRDPALDEIDLRHRVIAGPRPLGQVGVGMIGPGSVYHVAGLMNLLQAVNTTTSYRADFKGTIDLKQEVADCQLLIMAGGVRFNVTVESEAFLKNFLDRGGVLLGEACGAITNSTDESVDFRDAFGELAIRLGKDLAPVRQGHPLLTSLHIFGGAPDGIDGPATIMADGGLVYSSGDFGCLWNGGRSDPPAPRETIRSAVELGINLCAYTARATQIHSLEQADL